MKKLIGHGVGSYNFDASAQTVTLAGIDNISLEQVLLITNTTDGTIIYNFSDPTKGGSVANNVITLAYDTSTMSDSDSLQVFVDLNIGDGYDINLDIIKTVEQSPIWSRYTDAESLITAAQTLTTSFADLGAEVCTSGYNTIGIWVKCTAQDSDEIQFRVQALHEVGGTEKYDLPVEIVSAEKITISPEVQEFPDTANFLYILKVNSANVIPYMQFQVKYTVFESGGSTPGTIDTAYVTKGY